MYGNGCAGSTASGVSTGKMRSSNSRVSCGLLVVVEVVPVGELDAGLLQTGRDVLGERARLPADELLDPGPDRAELLDLVEAVRATLVRTPAASCSCRPDTRTWKNSSRFELKIARNLARSSRGSDASSASASTRALKSSHDSSRLR